MPTLRMLRAITPGAAVDMVFGGLTPACRSANSRAWAMARPLRQRRPAGGAQIVREVVGSFKHTGSLDEVRERLASFEER